MSSKANGSQPRRVVRRVGVFINLLTHVTRSIATGFTRYANERGNWNVVLGHHAQVVFGDDSLKEFDGIAGGYSWELPSPACPIVYVHTPEGPVPAPTVCADNRATGRMAADHLMSLGLPHFAFLGLRPNAFSKERQKGFEDAITTHGHVPQQAFLFESWQTMAHGAPRLAEWLSQIRLPCAVFCVDDRVASVLAVAAHQANVDVPEQLAILGVNDDDLACAAVMPSLSSIRLDGELIGYEAARELDRSMSGAPPNRSTVKRIPPLEVVQRGSTQVMGYDDPIVCEAMRIIRRRAPREPLVVDQIAGELGVSRHRLNRAFVQCVGQSPKEATDRLRAERLQQLLQNTTSSILQITDEMGFGSQSQVIRFSRRMLGNTPLVVRERSCQMPSARPARGATPAGAATKVPRELREGHVGSA